MSWLTARCGSRLKFASPGRTTAQVPRGSYTQVPGHFVQPIAAGGEKADEQGTLPELLPTKTGQTRAVAAISVPLCVSCSL
jgi:hypothetical protein